jgi:hypothetical protein
MGFANRRTDLRSIGLLRALLQWNDCHA